MSLRDAVGAGLALGFVLFTTGCVQLVDSTQRYHEFDSQEVFGEARVEVEFVDDSIDEEMQAALKEQLETSVGATDAPRYSLHVKVGECSGLAWLWLLPPVWRSSSEIQYSLELKDSQGELLQSSLRTRIWRRYFATYSKERLVDDFVDDVRAALAVSVQSSPRS